MLIIFHSFTAQSGGNPANPGRPRRFDRLCGAELLQWAKG